MDTSMLFSTELKRLRAVTKLKSSKDKDMILTMDIVEVGKSTLINYYLALN